MVKSAWGRCKLFLCLVSKLWFLLFVRKTFSFWTTNINKDNIYCDVKGKICNYCVMFLIIISDAMGGYSCPCGKYECIIMLCPKYACQLDILRNIVSWRQEVFCRLEGCLTVHLPHEIIWNANLMQQGNFIDVVLAQHVSATYAHHQLH